MGLDKNGVESSGVASDSPPSARTSTMRISPERYFKAKTFGSAFDHDRLPLAFYLAFRRNRGRVSH